MAKTYKYHFIYHIRILVGSKKDYFYVGLHSTNNIDDGYCGSGRRVSDIIKGLRKKGHKDSEIYERTILTFATSRKEVIELESIYVTPIIRDNKYCLNEKSGGEANNEYSEETKQLIAKRTSIGVRKMYKERPEIRKKQKLGLKKHYEDQTAREKLSIIQKKHYEEHPERKEKQSKISKISQNRKSVKEKKSIAMKNFLKNPNERKRWSDIQKKCYDEHPEKREKMSVSMKKHYEDPKNRERARQNSIIIGARPDVKEKRSKKMSSKKWVNKNGERKRVHVDEVERYIADGWSLGKKLNAA